jgi:hypothetical protein
MARLEGWHPPKFRDRTGDVATLSAMTEEVELLFIAILKPLGAEGPAPGKASTSILKIEELTVDQLPRPPVKDPSNPSVPPVL